MPPGPPTLNPNWLSFSTRKRQPRTIAPERDSQQNDEDITLRLLNVNAASASLSGNGLRAAGAGTPSTSAACGFSSSAGSWLRHCPPP